MTNPWIAALLALFVWWFSTGAILWAVRRADGQGPRAHRRLAILGLPLLIGGVALAALTRDAGGQAALFGGFLSALAVWGWIELAFLTGLVTGPARGPLPFCLTGGQRFRAAWRAVAWHEILLAAGLVLLGALTLGAENTLAFWTYAILFVARISAKLNIFLGVPRINTEFLPRPLDHLPSYFRQGPVSWLFPLSILVLTLAVFCWIERLVFTGEMRFALLATLTGLALLEHWLMVLPLPDAKLWRWMLPAPTLKDDLPQSETPNGF